MKLHRFYLLILSALLFAGIPVQAQPDENIMFTHFIDVGQGMSVLLEFPHGAVLIDAGCQEDHENTLITYLKDFFVRRPDLNNTFNTVFITHQHVDHNLALDNICTGFKILNYIDNGNRKITVKEKNQIWMQDNASTFNIAYEPISYEAITYGNNKQGLTDSKIDAVGGSVDPVITVYSGAFKNKPDTWNEDDYKEANNHSLVIKVVFWQSSFLFSGDLEDKAIETVLSYYRGTGALDADVMQVGHHGSRNATTVGWLNAITPKYALISSGHWYDGKLPNLHAKPFTTYAYAHPNMIALTMLENSVSTFRPEEITETVGLTGSFNGSIPTFAPMSIKHSIYDTAWDGNIVVQATSQGSYTILTNH